MNLTINSKFDGVLQRHADKINAARPLDANKQPIGDAITAEQAGILLVEANLQSLLDAENDEKRRLMIPASDAILAAAADKTTEEVAAAVQAGVAAAVAKLQS